MTDQQLLAGDQPNDVDTLTGYLTSFTYQWSTEVELQDAIWGILSDPHRPEWMPVVAREVRLSAGDRPDFLVTVGDSTIAVEVKVKGSRNAVLRQLGRYATHAEVDAVLLASGRRVLAAAMPRQLHDKPLCAIHLESGR